ncbi:MAG: efflux RND transporter permease subunit [Nevskia sp.]|jgi:multidrug efflux pump subunit AcrB|nr:efflux RND transporter permease subunit [Nevskia sp.]
MWITKTSISQPVFATMVMVALLVLGMFSYNRLPVEQFPDVSSPYVSISVSYPGASPEAIENDLLKPLENVVNTVEGVKRIYGTAREGLAFIQIEFRLTVDIATAAQEVRDKVAQIRPSFPREAKDPLVTRTNNDANQQPIIDLTVYSETRSLREVSTLVDQIIVKRLQNAQGVGNVAVSGSAVRQIQIFLKPGALESYHVGVDQVVAAVQDSNQDLPAGSISRGAAEQLVRVEGKIKEPAAFGRIIVATQAGAPIYLEQVASVVDGEAEETSISRVDGKRAIGLSIFRVQDANIVEVGDSVQAAIKDLQARLPDDVKIKVINSNSDFIKDSLKRVKETIIEGGLLTVFIVFLFLHSWRSTIITGLTLPISVIASFIALHAFGFTLNFLTLMALSLCIGLLIDDAIVVRENIVRHLAMGKSHVRAALDGTQEIGLAVMATTFAIIAVFVPVAFMNGIIGRYFFQFGITVAVAVMVSLFVSFTLDPMLSSVWRDPVKNRFKYVPWLGRVMERIEVGVEALHGVYGRLLERALSTRRRRVWFPLFGLTHALRTLDYRQWGTISNRGIVLWLAALIFFGSFFLVPFIGSEFTPEGDEGFISLRLNTPLGSSLEYTDAKTRQVEAILKEFPEVETVATEVGTDEGKNYSRINLRLVDKDKTPRRSQKEMEKLIRARIANVAGMTLSVGFGGSVFISLLGPDADKLTEISQNLIKEIAKIPGIADLESSEKGANPGISVRINNELASDLGLSTARIGNALRPLVAGDQISHWLGPDGQDYDVIVRLPKGDRQIASDLGELALTSTRLQPDGSPRLVPLRQVVSFVESASPQQIKRQDLQRRVSIYANAEGRPSGDVGADVQKLIKNTKLPPGYRFNVAGAQENIDESGSAALAALGLAVIFIYLILASQFGSFLQPIAIMVSLPLSLSGVFIALLVTGTTLNLFSIIGFIMLMGLVTKNAILLVDFANQALREGRTLREALLSAGQVRLRPILMTTLAMIFGMLPMALGLGKGGETQAPMGRAVIGGIITSTLLTLVVVPVLYTYIHALGARFSAWFGHKADDAPPEADEFHGAGGGALAAPRAPHDEP